jgi:NAD(P)-dependent dehydrogenase (short-subunit alcohol dehydrogenase family)
MAEKWTEAEIPDLGGRTAIVTGANTGLGLETARALAEKGATVVLAVRNLEKGRAAIEWITARRPGARVSLQSLDLTSGFGAPGGQRDRRGPPAHRPPREQRRGDVHAESRTADGFELQLGTNHSPTSR